MPSADASPCNAPPRFPRAGETFRAAAVLTAQMIATIFLAAAVTILHPHDSLTRTIAPGARHEYELRLDRGRSAEVAVTQNGVDVVVDLFGPDGALIDSVDGPTGRSGDEVAELFATAAGTYRIVVRPYDEKEPAGPYRIALRELRSAAATRALLDRRRAARDEAAAWLRAHAVTDLASIARARVVGLGEATHGSREFGDTRLALTKELVEKHGFRAVAVESSNDTLGDGGGWINGRTFAALVAFARQWNELHPSDRMRVIGVDAQHNAKARALAGAFVRAAYPALVAQWEAAEKELAAADEQSEVFGDSSVKPAVRDFLFALRTRITFDEPLVHAGDAVVNAIDTLATFADYNAYGKSRDWYMAAAVLRATASGERAVFWAHNAHVAARTQTAGAFLRNALGCGYAAVALTFGEGSFIAQMPNDRDDRVVASTLSRASDAALEAALIPVGAATIAWPCGTTDAPEWLRTTRPMHWIGGLWDPASPPSAAYRGFDVLHDFDGVVFIPRVTAEDVPQNRPHIPARSTAR